MMLTIFLIFSASLHGNKLVAYTLIHNKANIDLRDINGKTCLMIAVINGHLQLVELLLEHNANVTIFNTVSRLPFYLFFMQDHNNCCCYLVIQSIPDQHFVYQGLDYSSPLLYFRF